MLDCQFTFSYWSILINPFYYSRTVCLEQKPQCVASVYPYTSICLQWAQTMQLSARIFSSLDFQGPSSFSSLFLCFFWWCTSSQWVVTWLFWCWLLPPTSYIPLCTSFWAIFLSWKFGIPQLRSPKPWPSFWGEVKPYHLLAAFCRCTLFSHWAAQSISY